MEFLFNFKNGWRSIYWSLVVGFNVALIWFSSEHLWGTGAYDAKNNLKKREIYFFNLPLDILTSSNQVKLLLLLIALVITDRFVSVLIRLFVHTLHTSTFICVSFHGLNVFVLPSVSWPCSICGFCARVQTLCGRPIWKPIGGGVQLWRQSVCGRWDRGHAVCLCASCSAVSHKGSVSRW